MAHFNPEVISVMVHTISKEEILNIHKTLKGYTKKVSKKSELINQLTGLLTEYEKFYHKVSPHSNLYIDKTKLSKMTQLELLGIHTLFRKCMRYTNTKQQAINNILAIAKQVQYFITY
jgi:hypothetical protein